MWNSCEDRRHGKERAKERVALHAQLQVGAVGRVAGDLEAGQRVHANLLVDDLLARPHGQPLPRLLALLLRLPDQAPPSDIPSSGLVWVNALGSQHSTTVTWRRSQFTRMRSGAATMKYEVGAPFFSDPYFGLALTWMISLGLPNSSTTLSRS